jgi:hypothetical protein
MSDFLTELRGDLVGAHARYGQRGRAGRVARPVHPRTWRPATILAAAAAAACVFAAVLGVRALRTPTPAKVRVVEQIRVGGQPSAAVAGFGRLWVADFNGNVIEVDPDHHRVVRRIPVRGHTSSVAVSADAVWATTEGDGGFRLVRIDPRTGRVTLNFNVARDIADVHAEGRFVWVQGGHDQVFVFKRIDAASGRTIATAPATGSGYEAVALGGDSLWALAPTGVLEQRDPESGRVLRRISALPSAIVDAGGTVLAADASGVWVLRPGLIVHVAGGRVVRRIPLRVPTSPTLGDDGRSLWVATGRQYPARFAIARLDRSTGKPTGTLDLGSHQPKVLVPSPRGIWVIGGDGTALLAR